MLNFDDFIEGHIVNISVPKHGATVIFQVECLSGVSRTITLFGVKRMRIDAVRESNIVDKITVYGKEHGQDEYEEILADLLVSNSSGVDRKEFLYVIEAERNSILWGEQVILHIESVYGAEAVAIGKRILIE